jgi:aryl-phospho-beta-D-glucosidase BglC (GH1 family)
MAIRLPVFLCIATSLLAARAAHAAEDKLAFWDTQRKGANCFNVSVDRSYFAACKAANIRLVRLTWSKWKGAGRDFLIGEANEFKGIPAADLAKLKEVLDSAHAEGVKVVLVPLSLPGLRWRQQNGMKWDDRIWRDEKYHAQAAAFWRELAMAMRDHPAVVGYNLINEPAPARALKIEFTDTASYRAFEMQVVGTAADVNRLYRTLTDAVRAVDKQTPVIVESHDFGAPDAIAGLEPIPGDERVIYSIHNYGPWQYVNFKANGGRNSYPGVMTINDRQETWDREALRQAMAPVAQWAERHRVPPTRIFLGEFGCDRRNAGVAEYLADVIAVANDYGWHWAFYAYREDEWDAMDYELGTGKLGAKYWEAVERGERPTPPRKDNPLWRVIEREFQ